MPRIPISKILFFPGSEGTLGTTLGNKHTPILHSPDQECHPGNSA